MAYTKGNVLFCVPYFRVLYAKFYCELSKVLYQFYAVSGKEPILPYKHTAHLTIYHGFKGRKTDTRATISFPDEDCSFRCVGDMLEFILWNKLNYS